MSQGQGHIVDVQRWADEHRGTLDQAGVEVKAVPTNPEHGWRSKTAQSLQLGRNGLLAEIVIWTSGECEVLYGDDPRAVSVEQRSIRSPEEFEALMGELLERLYS